MFGHILGQIEVRDIINYVVLGRNLKTWLLALILIFLAFTLKSWLTSFCLAFFKKTIFREKEMSYQAEFIRKFNWIFPLSALHLVNNLVLRLAEPGLTAINRLVKSAFIIWTLMVVELVVRELFVRLRGVKPEKFTPTVERFSLQLVRAGLATLGTIMVLQLFQINVAGIVTGLGIGGLAVSMAAKDIIADMIGGFTIMSEKIFAIGDYIKSPDVEGTVEDIKFRQSLIRSPDESLVSVPNSLLTENYVVNFSRMKKRRINLTISLPHFVKNRQIDELKALIKSYIEGNDAVDHSPGLVVLESINGDGVNLLVRYYTKGPDHRAYMEEQDRLYHLIWTYLGEHGLGKDHILLELNRQESVDFD